MLSNRRHVLSAALVLALLSGCSHAPTYNLPQAPGQNTFKEAAGNDAKWQVASPDAGQVDTKNWWVVFNDSELNALETQMAKNNPDLQAAAARVEQLSAVIAQVRANLYPQVGLSAGVTRGNLNTPNLATNYSLLGTVSYAVDLFGRVRDATRAARFDREQAEALYNQVMLLLQADVAQYHFALQALDSERDLLRQTIALREESQGLVQRRFREGESSEQESLRASAELASTRAELSALDQQRSLIEHALATLLGQAPSEFDQAERKLPTALPVIPAGLPSSVLERRPDIAAAEADLAASNARIGLARAAFFPTIGLTAQGGTVSDDLGGIFDLSNDAWAVGPLLSLPIFDGGRRRAGVALSDAVFRESIANYRSRVLNAFREVEDNLSSLRELQARASQLYDAAETARKAEAISRIRYREGEANFLEVLDTQRDTLTAQRLYTQTQGQRFGATVNLIRALGGGWDVAKIAPAEAAPVKQAPDKMVELPPAPLAPTPKTPVATPPAQKLEAVQKAKPAQPAPTPGLIFD